MERVMASTISVLAQGATLGKTYPNPTVHFFQAGSESQKISFQGFANQTHIGHFFCDVLHYGQHGV